MNKILKPAFLIPTILITAFFLYWEWAFYISRDLVWDEVVSLKNFVLTGLNVTVGYYPDVNNHVFFNLLNNFYCKFYGIGDVYEAMDHVVGIRMFTAFITVLTLIYTYKIGNKFFGQNAGFISVIILLTTMPFLNFTMQLRGYTLSMAFMAMSVYYLWSFERKQTWYYALGIVLTTFGFLYSIPSNIYFIMSLGIIYFIKWIYDAFKPIPEDSEITIVKQWFLQKDVYLLLFFIAGTALAFLAYLPILEDILNERHLEQLKGKSHYAHTFNKVIPYVLYYLLSYRFLLLIPFVAIFFAFYKSVKENEKDERYFRLLFLLLIILISFGISLARGDRPHQRTFTPLAPAFAVMFGGLTHYFLNDIKLFKGRQLLSFSIVFIYCVSSFFYCDHLREKTLAKAILKGKKTYNMFYNFYQSENYNIRSLDPLIQRAKKTGYPIIMAKEIDRVAEGEYLHKNDLRYYSTAWVRKVPTHNAVGWEYHIMMELSMGKNVKVDYELIAYEPNISEEAGFFIPIFSYMFKMKMLNQKDPKCYVLTYAPHWFERMMRKSMPEMRVKKLSKGTTYHNYYQISFR